MSIEKNSDKKINIMFLFHCAELNNGAVRSLVDVIERLVKIYNVNAVVVSPSGGTAIEYLEKIGVKCFVVRYGIWSYRKRAGLRLKIKQLGKIFVHGLMGLLNVGKLKKIIENENINLLYTNTNVVYMGALLHDKCGIPHIWHIREFGMEDHGLQVITGDKLLYNKLNSSADAVIYISKSIKAKYQPKLMENKRQYTIYNDISPSFAQKKTEFNTDQPLQMAIIGSLQEGKGQLEAIKATKIVKNEGFKAVLHIAGNPSGEYYNKLVDYVDSHNLNDVVVFDGFIRNVNEYRSKMDVAIVASSMEAFGRVTVEGMLSMLAVIGADSAGTSELVEHMKTGILYKLHDTRDLADKIIMFCSDRNLLKEIALKGYEYAEENFAKGKAADKIYSVINEVLNGD